MNDKIVEAPRIRTPGWRDPRLIVGVILVVLSVAGVVALMQAADSRQGYWAASVDVVPGVKVKPEDFHVVQASMSEASDIYWSANKICLRNFMSPQQSCKVLAQRQVNEADPGGRQQVGIRIPRYAGLGYHRFTSRCAGLHLLIQMVEA